jgi:hypothetical protein
MRLQLRERSMAKKAAKRSKGAKKKAAPRRGSAAANTIGPRAKRAVPKRPTTGKLPGMEQPKDKRFDELAKIVADGLYIQAEGRQQVASARSAVHNRMKALGWTTALAHGVEFVRVPGDEKLTIKMTKGEEQGEDMKGDEQASEREELTHELVDGPDGSAE